MELGSLGRGISVWEEIPERSPVCEEVVEESKIVLHRLEHVQQPSYAPDRHIFLKMHDLINYFMAQRHIKTPFSHFGESVIMRPFSKQEWSLRSVLEIRIEVPFIDELPPFCQGEFPFDLEVCRLEDSMELGPFEMDLIGRTLHADADVCKTFVEFDSANAPYALECIPKRPKRLNVAIAKKLHVMFTSFYVKKASKKR